MNEKINKNKVKGSVLFTVISVMMVMTVLIFAALTLAASANRRVHNSYANNQTQYTARSVIETICEAMENSSDFNRHFVSLEVKGQSVDIEVQLPGNDSSMGKIVGNPTVTLLGTGQDYGYASDKNMYKITATVEMAGQENTVSGYFLAERVDNSMPFNYALVALESSTGADNMGVMGGASVGVNGISNWQIWNQNAAIQTPVNVNGGIDVGANAYLLLSRAGEGVYAGDYLAFINDGHQIQSDLNLDKNNNSVIDNDERLKYKDLPYVYVGKTLKFHERYHIASQSNPVIVMVDNLASPNKGSKLFGDMYIYADSNRSSDIYLSGADNGIRQWDAGFVKKMDNATSQGYRGGNIYSMGNLDIWCDSGSVGNAYHLSNNTVADSINLNASAVTDGAVVANSINIQNSAIDATFEDGLYVNHDNLVRNNSVEEVYNFKINGQQYTPPNYAERDVKIYEDEISFTDSTINGQAYELKWNNYLYIPFDFSTVLPENTDKIVVEPTIEIDIARLPNHLLIQRPYAVCQIFRTNDDGTYSTNYSIEKNGELRASILNQFTTSTIDFTNGRLGIYIISWDNNDLGKEIFIESISVKFKVTAYETETYIESQLDDREYLRSVNDVAFANNSNIICIDDIDKSVKLEKYEDGYGGYELKISKADLTAVEEGYECDPTKVNYTEVGVYDYDNLESYAEFLRAVVNTVTFPDSMKKKEQPKTKPVVSVPEMVDVSFLEWTSYTDALGNDVSMSEQEYEAKIQTDKAFDHISETESLVYNFNGTNVTYTDNNGDTVTKDISNVTITKSCTFVCDASISRQITIEPSAENIYIKLVGGEWNANNFTFNNFSGKGPAILVDDDNGKKKVNFLVESGTNFTTDGHIMTKTYSDIYDAYKLLPDGDPDKKIDIMQNPSDQKYIPGILIFMEYDSDSTSIFKALNNVMVTGYLMAPSASIEVNVPQNSAYKYTANELYLEDDGSGGAVIKSNTISEVSKSGIAVIGGVIAKKTSLSNNPGCLYVNPNALLEVKGEKEMSLNEYECLYYQAY